MSLRDTARLGHTVYRSDEHGGRFLAGAPSDLRSGAAIAMVAAFEEHIEHLRRLAWADCQAPGCHRPAHPTRGYCGRYCEETAAADGDASTRWLASYLDPSHPMAETGGVVEAQMREGARSRARGGAAQAPTATERAERAAAAFARAYAEMDRDTWATLMWPENMSVHRGKVR